MAKSNRRQGARNVGARDPQGSLPLPHESVHRFLFDEGLHYSRPLNFPRSYATAVPRRLVAQPLRIQNLFSFLKSLAGPRGQRRRATGLRLLSKLRLRPFARECVRRKERREVLHAFQRVGFAGSTGGPRRFGGKSYRRTEASQYGC